MPAMLSQIISKLIEDQEDMEALSLQTGVETTAEAVERSRPDVLVLSSSSDETREISLPLLRSMPNLRVIAITDSGRHATLCELRLHETRYQSISSEALVDTIRTVVRN